MFVCLFIWERRREGEREGEKHHCVVASHAPPPPGTWPTTQARVLTGNRTGDPLVRSPCSVHRATPARARLALLNNLSFPNYWFWLKLNFKTSKKLDGKVFCFKEFLFIFREGKGGRQRRRETLMCGCLEHPLLGTWPATQACALTGNRTSDLSVHKSTLNPHQPVLSRRNTDRCLG